MRISCLHVILQSWLFLSGAGRVGRAKVPRRAAPRKFRADTPGRKERTTMTTKLHSGYVPCECRDCFNVAIASGARKGAFCFGCDHAGCAESGSTECSRIDAYSGDVEEDNTLPVGEVLPTDDGGKAVR